MSVRVQGNFIGDSSVMDAIFQLGDQERSSFLFNLTNSCGFCYNCLWSYSSLHNWLTIKDAYYCDEANASTTVISLAQRLFEDYGQQSIPIAEVDLVPGIAFRQQSPYLELRGAEIQMLACCEPQRLFYQEAKIKTAVFMGCRSGVIELGLSKLPQIDLEAVMKTYFPEDFSRSSTRQSPAQDQLPNPQLSPYESNRPSSSSSLSNIDSPEYSSLLCNIPGSSNYPPLFPLQERYQITGQSADPTPFLSSQSQQSNTAAYGGMQQIPLPTAGSTDAVITGAILAILSAPSSSTPSNQQAQESLERREEQATNLSAHRSAFSSYNKKVFNPTGQIRSDSARWPNMMKRALAILRRLSNNQLQQQYHQQGQVGHPTANRVHHMISERRRREKINESFAVLRSMLPLGAKRDKASVLKATQEYMNSLKAQISVLDKRNQELEEQLFPTKKSKLSQQAGIHIETEDHSTFANERLQVRIVPTAESSSEARMVDLQVRTNGETSIEDLIIKILEYLKQARDVKVVMIEAQNHPGERNQAILSLRIEGNEWDESTFEEAIKRLLGDLV